MCGVPSTTSPRANESTGWGSSFDDITAIPTHWDGRTPDYSGAVGHLADLTYDYEINPN